MRKKLKRLLAGILSVMLVMGMTEIPAKKVEAAGAPEFTARFTDADGKTITTAHPGDEVQLVMSVKNAGVMTAFKVSLLYDESKVEELDGSGFSKAFKNYYRDLDDEGFYVSQNVNYDEYPGGAVLVYLADHKSKLPPAIEDDMDIAVIKLRVKEDMTGEVPVTIDYDSYAQGTGDMVYVNTKTLATTLNVKEQEIPATAIKLDKDTMALDLSGTTTGKLTASYEPENTTDKGNTVTWESSDKSVATVDKEGNVTAVGKGTANITASIVNAEGTTLTSKVCKVTVSKSVKSVTLDQTEVGLKQGQKKTLKATVTPSDADDATVTWKSSASDVVKVDQDGNIEAVAESGEATITASTKNGKSASCKVTVRTQHLGNVAFGQDEIRLAKDEEDTLAVTYTPDKALITDELTDEKWESSDSAVVTVDQEGNIKAVGKGTADITYSVKADGVEKKATTKVTVYVPVTSIAITATPNGNLLKGTSKTLTAVLTPGDADSYDLEWSISTANATLEAKGNTCTVTGVSEGPAIVTVKDKVSGVTAELLITVTEKKITKVNVTAEKTTLNKGDETTVTAAVEPADTTDDTTIKWTSSNEKVATVDATGKITAVGGGKATIIATSTVREDVQGTVGITVNVPLQSISIGEGDVELVKGQGTTFKIESYEPEDTTEDVKNVTWESSDKSVATVDKNGNVKALKAGKTTITATVAGKEASRTVNVKEYPLNGIELAETAKTVDKADGAFELELLKKTEDGHDTTDTITSVEWTSSEESVATVTGDNEKATVTPVGAGTTRITVCVTTDAGARTVYEASCDVTVVIPLTGVEIYKDGTNVTGNTMQLVKDDSFTLNASPVPADTTDDTTVTWESSDPTSVSVNDGVVTALKESTEPVTITAKIGNKTAEIKVTAEEIHIESIILNKNYMKLDAKGLTAAKEEKLTVTYVPENTTDAKQIKTWSTSDSTVATVSADGIVTAVAAGTATITAVTENGKTVSCEVVVEKHIDSIEFTAAKTTIKRKETVDLTTAINPEDATVDKTLEYSVDNADVLDISKLATEGKVTGLKEGTATVTVTAVNAPETPSAQLTLVVEEDHATADDFKFEDDQPGVDVHKIRVDEKNPSIAMYYMEGAFTDDVISKEYQVTEGADIVDVDEVGNLTFKARSGNATIEVTIKVQNGSGAQTEIVKEYKLELVEVPVEEITLEQNLSMTVGEDKTLNVTFKPEDTTNKGLTWESSDPSIATVTAGEDGQAVVHALKAGTVTITAKTTETQEGLTAQTTITVKDKPVIENPDKKPGQTTGQPGTGNKKPSNKNNQGNKKSVKTGDESPILPIAATGMISLIVILAILILKRHRKAY